MTNFKAASLFGGAIATELPTAYVDVSNIRQVPDNQEIYITTTGFTSVIVEILERVTDPADDVAALHYHFRDLTDDEGTRPEIKFWTESKVQLAHHSDVPAYTLLATTPPGEEQRGDQNAPDFVAVVLTLVRLVEVKADLLVVVNVPHVKGEYEVESLNFEAGAFGGLVDEGLEIREKVLETLKIVDWGLFGEQ